MPISRPPRDVTLAWLAVPGARSYRLCRRDGAAGETRTLHVGGEAAFAVTGDARTHSYRVEVLLEGEPDYVTLVPFAEAGAEAEDALHLEAPARDGVPAWRLILRDETADAVVLDAVRFTPGFGMDAATLPEGHQFRYRFLWWDWRQKKWEPAGPYAPLFSGAASAAPPHAAVTEAGRGAGLAAFVTIDTEANLRLMREPDRAAAIEQQVFGRVGGAEVGIGCMMDQLDARGLKGTFFVDVLMEYQFGQTALERTIEAIAGRGHDIQLHMHPSPNFLYADDAVLTAICRDLARGPAPEAFARALDIAVALFEKRVGRAPLAFRNGSYHIHDSYFDILRAAGIRYDSTVYRFKNCAASPWIQGRTQPFEVVPGLWELPVTWVVSRHVGGGGSAVSQFTSKVGQGQALLQRAMLELAAAPGRTPSLLVMMLHSYNYLGEFRAIDPALAQAWNERLKSFAPLLRSVRRGLNDECLFLEGVSQENMDSIMAQLDVIASLPNSRALTFTALAHDHARLLGRAAPIEPLAEYERGSGQSRLAAIRRYSRDGLRHLAGAAPP